MSEIVVISSASSDDESGVPDVLEETGRGKEILKNTGDESFHNLTFTDSEDEKSLVDIAQMKFDLKKVKRERLEEDDVDEPPIKRPVLASEPALDSTDFVDAVDAVDAVMPDEEKSRASTAGELGEAISSTDASVAALPADAGASSGIHSSREAHLEQLRKRVDLNESKDKALAEKLKMLKTTVREDLRDIEEQLVLAIEALKREEREWETTEKLLRAQLLTAQQQIRRLKTHVTVEEVKNQALLEHVEKHKVKDGKEVKEEIKVKQENDYTAKISD